MTGARPTHDEAWMESADVLRLLGHRYPFLLIDRLRVVEPGRRALGLKRVTGAEWPSVASAAAIREMPGMLVVEALAQATAGILVGLLDESTGAIGYFASANRVRFRELPRSGDTLLLSVELVSFRRGIARIRGVATVDNRLAASATFAVVVRGRIP